MYLMLCIYSEHVLCIHLLERMILNKSSACLLHENFVLSTSIHELFIQFMNQLITSFSSIKRAKSQASLQRLSSDDCNDVLKGLLLLVTWWSLGQRVIIRSDTVGVISWHSWHSWQYWHVTWHPTLIVTQLSLIDRDIALQILINNHVLTMTGKS